MINILISGAGGDVANGILKSLLITKIKFNFYIVGSNKLVLKEYPLFNTFKSPLVKKKRDYINFLKDIIKKEKIDFFFPCINSEINLISKNKSHLKCLTLIDAYRNVSVFNDKWSAYKFFVNNRIYTPVTKLLNSKIVKFNFPYIVKQRLGSGSKGMKIINNKFEFSKLRIDKKFIIQEFLYGDDYTSGIYKINNKVKIIVFQRILVAGRTHYAKKINSQTINCQLKNIFVKLGLSFANIQFKLDRQKNIFVYEVNPRFSGTIGLQSIFFNYPSIFIKFHYKKKIFYDKKKKISAYRFNDFSVFGL
jgi:carbamoyl-phosphate synthase large subunit